MQRPIRFATCLATLAIVFATPAHALTTQQFSNLATFQAASSATSATGALPSPGGPGSISSPIASQTVGSVTIVAPGWHFTEWSTLLPGAEIAVSQGAGNTNVPTQYYNDGIDAIFSAPVFAAGFDFHQATTPNVAVDGCNTPVCFDSQFQVQLKNGATVVATFAWTPLKDQRDFWGVWADTPFNKLEIRETFGTDDNEFYGQFYSGVTAVPEPATTALWALGLLTVGLAGMRRRG
jgi:hypothetical protein